MQPHYLTKTLTAGSANNISLSQSPGAGAILLNGATAAGGGAIATLGAITAGSGGTVPGTIAYQDVPLTGGAGSGAVAGSIVVVAGAVAAVSLISGAPGTGYAAANSLGVAAGALGNVTGFAVAVGTVTGAVATLDTQRRIQITSGGTDTGITFTVNGTNDVGATISDTFAGGSAGTPAISNLDFRTVTSVTHTGSVAGTLTIGTVTAALSPLASTPWFITNNLLRPYNAAVSGVVTGTVNYTIEYTYQDPNNLPSGLNFPVPFFAPGFTATSSAAPVSATKDGAINDPVTAIRFTLLSGTTGSLLGTILEAGLNS